MNLEDALTSDKGERAFQIKKNTWKGGWGCVCERHWIIQWPEHGKSKGRQGWKGRFGRIAEISKTRVKGDTFFAGEGHPMKVLEQEE